MLWNTAAHRVFLMLASQALVDFQIFTCWPYICLAFYFALRNSESGFEAFPSAFWLLLAFLDTPPCSHVPSSSRDYACFSCVTLTVPQPPLSLFSHSPSFAQTSPSASSPSLPSISDASATLPSLSPASPSALSLASSSILFPFRVSFTSLLPFWPAFLPPAESLIEALFQPSAFVAFLSRPSQVIFTSLVLLFPIATFAD